MHDALPIFNATDGVYRLSKSVTSPLPARLTRGRRKKGWARRYAWAQGDRFEITGGWLTCQTYHGVSASLGVKHAAAVVAALCPYLEPVPTLPSDVIDEYVTSETLDALFLLGKITLDDVREAETAHVAATALGNLSELHASEFLDEPEDPVVALAAQACASSSAQEPGLREGDVIQTQNCSLFAFTGRIDGGRPVWSSQSGFDITDVWHGSASEPVVGHLADMLAAGVAALAGPKRLRVGDVVYDKTSEGPNPDHYVVLQVLSSDRYLWKRDHESATDFTATWVRHREPVAGHVADMIAEGMIAIQRSATAELVGFDRNGHAVRCGDVLVSQTGETRVRVIGRAEPLYGESAALYVRLAGPAMDVNAIALGSANKWAIERPAPSPFPKAYQTVAAVDPFSLD